MGAYLKISCSLMSSNERSHNVPSVVFPNIEGTGACAFRVLVSGRLKGRARGVS